MQQHPPCRFRAFAMTFLGLLPPVGATLRAANAAELPVVPAMAVAAAEPAIDGELGDAAWSQALVLPIDGWCDRTRRAKGEKPLDTAEARMITGRECLYVAFSCAESHPDGPWLSDDVRESYKKRNYQVLAGDYCALALDLGRFGFYANYFIAVSPRGEVYRCFSWPHRYDLILKDAGLPEIQGAAMVDRAGKRWTAELRIPLVAELLRHPGDGLPRRLGVDLRRVQWGADRGQQKFSIYWTGMAQVERGYQKPQYDHMATWRPLFDNYPNYSTSYACGEGWTQLTMPEWFGAVLLAAGTIDNPLVIGQGARLLGHVDARTGWDKSRRAGIEKELDAPRMEYWDDLRPAHPAGKPEIVPLPAADMKRPPGRFRSAPSIAATGGATRIAFAAAGATDCAVAVLDAQGQVIRHLAAGLLGARAPEPFRRGSLEQVILWDGRDDSGRAVAPGEYRVSVALGLNPKFDHAIAMKREWVDADKWPGGLDIEHIPTPPDIGKAWPSNHSGYAFGNVNYLSIDRQREELYIQSRYIHDGVSGELLRELMLNAPAGAPFDRRFGNGEIALGPDDLLYVSGANEIWRFDRKGQPVPFPALARSFLPELWGAHSNPHRGLTVAPDGAIYKLHHYVPHSNFSHQLTRIDADGRIRDYGFVELRCPAAGIKVDRQGNLYVGCAAQPAGSMPPQELAAKLPDVLRARYPRLYGSIFKFGPAGGTLLPDPQGELVLPGRKGMEPFAARGALWVRPGFSPLLSRIPDSAGGPGCACRNGRFDLDAYGRLFVPDAVSGRVEVLDGNGNTLARFGARGRTDAGGTELGWGTQVVVSDRACYVADYLRLRVVRVKIEYDAQQLVAVIVGRPTIR